MRTVLRIIPAPSLILLTGIFLSLPACPTPGNGTPDGGPGGPILGRCSTDLECPRDFLCHRELLRCVCTDDTACPANLFCNAFTGRCVTDVPGCGSDTDCAPNKYCDVSARTCRDRRAFCEACTEDIQCGLSSDKCVNDATLGRSFCGQACSTDTDCTEAGTTCQDIGGVITCWPEVATCEQLAGCTPDTGQACTADVDCTDGADQVCDAVQGTCVAALPTCPFGQVCDRDTATCTAACVTDDECNLDPDCENIACRCTNNQCVAVSVCTQNNECEPGKVCVIEPGQADGECGRACDVDSDCPQGLVCADLGSRKACTPGCLTSDDCSLAQNCSGGQCVTGCQTNEVCQLCQLCEPINTQVSQCVARGAQYCQNCTPPAQVGQCWQSGGTPPYADSWCCNLPNSPSAVWGTPCRLGCPQGFGCVSIGNLAQNCFPVGNTCNDPSCN